MNCDGVIDLSWRPPHRLTARSGRCWDTRAAKSFVLEVEEAGLEVGGDTRIVCGDIGRLGPLPDSQSKSRGMSMPDRGMCERSSGSEGPTIAQNDLLYDFWQL